MKTALLIACCSLFLLAGCGKKPSQLQPIAAPINKDPAYYPYPKIQPAPPVPSTPSSP